MEPFYLVRNVNSACFMYIILKIIQIYTVYIIHYIFSLCLFCPLYEIKFICLFKQTSWGSQNYRLTSVGYSGRQRGCWSWWRQVEVHHGAVGLVADHHAGDLRPLLVPHQAGGVSGQHCQVGLHGAAARHKAADRTLLTPVWDGLQETCGYTPEPLQVYKLFHMKPANLVLHLVLTLIQVLILETPLVLHMNVDVKLPRLSLSQLTNTHTQWLFYQVLFLKMRNELPRSQSVKINSTISVWKCFNKMFMCSLRCVDN